MVIICFPLLLHESPQSWHWPSVSSHLADNRRSVNRLRLVLSLRRTNRWILAMSAHCAVSFPTALLDSFLSSLNSSFSAPAAQQLIMEQECQYSPYITCLLHIWPWQDLLGRKFSLQLWWGCDVRLKALVAHLNCSCVLCVCANTSVMCVWHALKSCLPLSIPHQMFTTHCKFKCVYKTCPILNILLHSQIEPGNGPEHELQLSF